MTKLLLAIAVLTLLVAAGTGVSGAAFVKTAETAAPASADTITRWLDREACPPSGTEDCAFVVRARDPLPEGAHSITVAVSGDGEPGLGTDGASVTLAPGETRPVHVTPGTTGREVVTVAPTGETPGFLRSDVPVTLARDDEEQRAPAPAPAAGSPSAAAAPLVVSVPPAVAQSEAKSTAPTCTSRRRFTLTARRPPRGTRLKRVHVLVDHKLVPVRRRHSRFVATIDLRGVQRSTTTVLVTARTVRGKLLREVRRYRTCAARSAPGT